MVKSKEKNAHELDDVRRMLRRELVNRHAGQYQAVSSIENHMLPYECELAKKDRNWFESLDAIEFLHLPSDESKNEKLTKRDFREACDRLYTNTITGSDYFQNAKKTISKHIQAITNQSLFEWTRGPHAQDAFRTGYLLYQLHLCTKSGLEMLTKPGDPRFAEVELFTSHHKPKNKKNCAEDDQVIVLSAWLKELFSKALFHRSEIERAMLKNLDLIFTGYYRVLAFISNEKDNKEKNELLCKIFGASTTKRSQQTPNDVLSVKLMRTWQMKVKYHNISNQLDDSVIEAFLYANHSHLRFTQPREHSDKDKKILKLGARLISWLLFQSEYKSTFKNLSIEETLAMIRSADLREEKIYDCLKNDFKNGVQLTAKGIGEDGKKTSIFNTLKVLVGNNIKALNQPLNTHLVLNLDNNCESHYNYLLLRARHCCYHPELSAIEFIDTCKKSVEHNSKSVEWLSRYIDSMTLEELHQDILRINSIMGKITGGEFRLLPRASEVDE